MAMFAYLFHTMLLTAGQTYNCQISVNYYPLKKSPQYGTIKLYKIIIFLKNDYYFADD